MGGAGNEGEGWISVLGRSFIYGWNDLIPWSCMFSHKEKGFLELQVFTWVTISELGSSLGSWYHD